MCTNLSDTAEEVLQFIKEHDECILPVELYPKFDVIPALNALMELEKAGLTIREVNKIRLLEENHG